MLHYLTDGETEPNLIDMTEKKGSDLISYITTSKNYYILPVKYTIRISGKNTEKDYEYDADIYKALTLQENSSKLLTKILEENQITGIRKIYLIPSKA